MIDLYNGELLDMLPPPLSRDVHEKCLSYALRRCVVWLIDHAQRTQTHSGTDRVSEDVLDELAVEFRAPYYDQSLPYEVKLGIVRHSFIWHLHSGTPSAVRELVETVFGRGDLTEWFDFEDGPGEPYTFDVETSVNPEPSATQRFRNIIDSVKNLRSHLRNLVVEIPVPEMELPIRLNAMSVYEDQLSWAPTHFDFEDSRIALTLGAYMIATDQIPNLMEA